ncbi:Dyp-type peroxidase [uncultured Friedmanniella sp.]|uniref:Dyp-type peroxidase n=1 Tax=uncultured Friedmanniella sp. TaxID=335381 RepID=UPI0035C97F60
MSRNLNAEPQLDTHAIQGDILPGLLKKDEALLFFTIDDVTTFRPFLHALPFTSMAEALEQRAEVTRRKQAGVETLLPVPGLNVAFTFAGLTKLGVAGMDTPAELAAFRAGMAGRTDVLADPPGTDWSVLGPGQPVDGVFVLTGASRAEIDDTIALHLAPVGTNGWTLVHEEAGTVRPDPVHGHEHFGYADGVSQPGVRGRTPDGQAVTPSVDPAGHPDQGSLGQDLLWPGEFVFGYLGQNPAGPTFRTKGAKSTPPVPVMRNGSFLVFRRLVQHVPEFDLAVKSLAATATTADNPVTPELMGAQLVGRWKSGAPLVMSPLHDDPALAEGTGAENDFEFDKDRDGTRCPYAAHVRKAYPRDDTPFSTDLEPEQSVVDAAEAFTQTHRMMRRGIAFGPELSHQEALTGVSDPGQQRGLLFKCYVTSIADQFEFVQQRWADNADFAQAGSGLDPIIGQSSDATTHFRGAAPVTLDPADRPDLSVSHFVSMQGGEYFFAPSTTALTTL